VDLRRKKILYVNGCSHACGAEIEGDAIGWKTEYNLKWCFAGQIARRYNLEYVNDALPGGSNDRIFRTTISWILKFIEDGGNVKELFCIIEWTSNKRFEFYDKDVRREWVFGGEKLPEFREKKEYVKFSKYAVVYLSSSSGTVIRRIIQTILLANFLKSYKIDFLMLNGSLNQGKHVFEGMNISYMKKFYPFENYFEPFDGFSTRYTRDGKNKEHIRKFLHLDKYLHTLYTEELCKFIEEMR